MERGNGGSKHGTRCGKEENDREEGSLAGELGRRVALVESAGRRLRGHEEVTQQAGPSASKVEGKAYHPMQVSMLRLHARPLAGKPSIL